MVQLLISQIKYTHASVIVPHEHSVAQRPPISQKSRKLPFGGGSRTHSPPNTASDFDRTLANDPPISPNITFIHFLWSSQRVGFTIHHLFRELDSGFCVFSIISHLVQNGKNLDLLCLCEGKDRWVNDESSTLLHTYSLVLSIQTLPPSDNIPHELRQLIHYSTINFSTVTAIHSTAGARNNSNQGGI